MSLGSARIAASPDGAHFGLGRGLVGCFRSLLFDFRAAFLRHSIDLRRKTKQADRRVAITVVLFDVGLLLSTRSLPYRAVSRPDLSGPLALLTMSQEF
jgi:hypothetical protein